MGELVAIEASNSAGEDMNSLEDNSVDFAAAAIAALGVPSPCLSGGKSFDDCPVLLPVEQGSRKGDREEADELMRALNLSKVEVSNPVDVSISPVANSSHILVGSDNIGSSGSGIHLDSSAKQFGVEPEESQQMDLSAEQQCNAFIDFKDGLNSNVSSTDNDAFFSSTNVVIKTVHSVPEDFGEFVKASVENVRNDLMPNQCLSFQSTGGEGSDGCFTYKGLSVSPREEHSVSQTSAEDFFTSQIPNRPADNPVDCDSASLSVQAAQYADIHSSDGKKELPDVSEVGSSSLDDSDPIYEGEECILDSGLPKYEDREPIYEGEMVLSRQADKMEEDACAISKNKVGLQLCKGFLL